MPKKKKPIQDMTKDELAKEFFPKKVRKELDRIAHERDGKGLRASP